MSAKNPTVTDEQVRTLLVTGGIGPGPTALATALELDGDVLVVGATSDAVEGIELAHLLQPDVVLVDQQLRLAVGTAVARHVLSDDHHAEVVLRTPWPEADRHDAERAGVFATVDVGDPVAAVAASIAAAGHEGRRTGRDDAATRDRRRSSPPVLDRSTRS